MNESILLELKKIVAYIKTNALKVSNNTWKVYKEQILGHIDDAEVILSEAIKKWEELKEPNEKDYQDIKMGTLPQYYKDLEKYRKAKRQDRMILAAEIVKLRKEIDELKNQLAQSVPPYKEEETWTDEQVKLLVQEMDKWDDDLKIIDWGVFSKTFRKNNPFTHPYKEEVDKDEPTFKTSGFLESKEEAGEEQHTTKK